MDESHYPFKYRVAVDGMMCSNCAARVQNTLNKMDGVWARVNLGRHRAEILAKSEKTLDDFTAALSETDYTATGMEQI
jgi:copper chaperone CopZ